MPVLRLKVIVLAHLSINIITTYNTVWIYTTMTITIQEHRQSFIDCIESAIAANDYKLARSLIVECEVYSENSGNELLTVDEIVVYYKQLSKLSILYNNHYQT